MCVWVCFGMNRFCVCGSEEGRDEKKLASFYVCVCVCVCVCGQSTKFGPFWLKFGNENSHHANHG
jgi:hypothetical protein